MKLIKPNAYYIILLALNLGMFTNSFSQTSLFSYEKYIGVNKDTLQYRQLVSDYDGLSKYPLVIFLHGSGERGNDNESQLKWGVMNFASAENMKMYRPIVIAPQCPEGLSWSSFSNTDVTFQLSPTKPMMLLIELINQTIKNHPVDPSRIYITGLSMGGFGTFDIMSRYPDLFAAAVPVCGGGDTSKARIFSQIPIWIFHGALDESVDSRLSREMVEALTKVGAKPAYTQYPEAGHFSWIAAYSDPMMMSWLFSQRK